MDAWLEILEAQVAHAAVRIVDHDRRRATRFRPPNRRVDIVGHHLPRAAVLRAGGRELIGSGDAADAFHVGGDEDFLTGLRAWREGEAQGGGEGEDDAHNQTPARWKSTVASAE